MLKQTGIDVYGDAVHASKYLMKFVTCCLWYRSYADGSSVGWFRNTGQPSGTGPTLGSWFEATPTVIYSIRTSLADLNCLWLTPLPARLVLGRQWGLESCGIFKVVVVVIVVMVEPQRGGEQLACHCTQPSGISCCPP